MRRFSVALTTVVTMIVALAPLASAADLPMSAPVVTAYNWNGFYVGGNIGYSWGSGDSWYNDPGFSGLVPTPIFGSQNMNGVIGGGQIGYNWQYQDNWVFGVEADFQGSDQKGSSSISNPFSVFLDDNNLPTVFSINQTFEAKILWFGTVRARAGLLIDPTLLAYLTGGLAYGRINIAGTITDTSVPTTWSFGSTPTNFGWTLGGGIEGAIPSTVDWTWKVEYLYIDLGSVSGTGFDPDFLSTFNWNTKVTDNIVRVGVNYRFH